MGDEVRVLHVMNGAVLGGISTVVLNYYKDMNRNKFRFDFAMHNVRLGPNGIALKQLGCKMFSLPLKSKHLVKYIKKLARIIKDGQYDIIHVHSGRTAYVALMVAKHLEISKRIAHTHTAAQSGGIKARVLDTVAHYLNPKVATTLLACSTDAARVAFGTSQLATRKTLILKNAIDVNKFRFNEETRNRVRKDLKLEGNLVIVLLEIWIRLRIINIY